MRRRHEKMHFHREALYVAGRAGENHVASG
jgi:hypothetical protein